MYHYHEPVLLQPSVDALVTNPDGTYVDVTFGGGGHSREILSRLSEKGKLISFDQDEDALTNRIDDPRFTLVNHNFSHLKAYLQYLGAIPVQGILADLGISSHQIDVDNRGFAHRFNGPLDMRMSQQSSVTAATLLNQSPLEELIKIFRNYGEIPNAGKLAQTIVNARKGDSFSTIEQFKQQISNCTPKATPAKYLSQVFQALRIAVNKEMEVLEIFLSDAEHCIATDGKLVVISYHSLEDRLVKHLFQTGNTEGKRHTNLYGGVDKPFDPQPNKAITPSEEEIERNKRARSAKMRIGVRNPWKTNNQ
jgi:16S rRNA (cytosine1402-N4)-methyltransferase